MFQIILDTDTEDKRRALGEVEERHRDLLKLEEDIKVQHTARTSANKGPPRKGRTSQ